MNHHNPARGVLKTQRLPQIVLCVFVATFHQCCLGERPAAAAEFGVAFHLGSGNEDVEKLLSVDELLHRDWHEFYKHLQVVTKARRINLSQRDLRSAEIHLFDGDIKDVSFAGSNLTDAKLQETHFYGCSFRGAKLCRAVFDRSYLHEDCDLEDADITGCKIAVTRKQLESTANFKRGVLSGMELTGDFEGCDFSNFDLSDTAIVSRLTGCNLTNADISGCELRNLTREQLTSTKNFKEGDLYGVTLFECDLKGVDFSGFDLGEFVDCDLTGAVFENANFASSGFNCSRDFYFGFTRCVLSPKQFYSTRNYKSKSFRGSAERIKLSGMNLDNWRFDNLDLRGLTFHICSLNGASFVDARGGSFRACDPTIEQIKSMWNYKNNSLNDVGFHISDEIRQKLK